MRLIKSVMTFAHRRTRRSLVLRIRNLKGTRGDGMEWTISLRSFGLEKQKLIRPETVLSVELALVSIEIRFSPIKAPFLGEFAEYALKTYEVEMLT